MMLFSPYAKQALKIKGIFNASRTFPNMSKKVLLPQASVSFKLQLVPKPFEITCKLGGFFEKTVVAKRSICTVGKYFAYKVFCSQKQ